MATKVSSKRLESGFTLLELLLVMAMLGILASVAAWGGQEALRDWRLKTAGHQLYEDIKETQALAEGAGSMVVRGGVLVSHRFFLVLNEAGTYATYQWQDDDNNGMTEENEVRLLKQKRLPEGSSFSWGQDVNRRACSNTNTRPAAAISFSTPSTPPCDGNPCIKFDHNGFSVMGPGAIYISNGQQSLAITATRPGHITMCEWDGARWQ